MELHLKGKSVVITGGSTGIGLETALEFAREDARVLICGRSEDKLQRAREQFIAEGMIAECYAADLSRHEGVAALADYALRTFGGMDVWFNNAGTSLSKPITDFTDDDLELLIRTNFKSVYWGCAAAGCYMKGHGGGVILNTTSFAVKMPLTNGGLYAATKSAVQSLTKSFAAELAPYNVRTLAIIPGFIETPLTEKAVAAYRKELTSSIPAGRLGKPEDLAKTIVFLASDACRYMTGVSVEISGGKFAVQDPMTPWMLKT